MVEINILLIDIDSMRGNLALASISAYYKLKGYKVGFNIDNPDKVYISCIFRKNKFKALGIGKMFGKGVEVHVGGSGVSWEWLPEAMQKIKPDYNLYNWDRSVGFTSRGCIRKCNWCVVPQKEGEWEKCMHISEFWDDRFSKVELLDNNIFVDKDWFFENTDFILDHKLKVIEHGMDVRLLDREIVERLSEMKFSSTMHFAFDDIKDEKVVRKGIALLKDAGIDIKHNVQFYVLSGFNGSIESDKYRVRLLKKLGTNAFVMPFKIDSWTNALARYCNRKHVYWSCDIDEYAPEFVGR